MTDKILDCGHSPSMHSEFTTGYGEDSAGRKHCYQCCADNDRKVMIDTGRATLYLTGTNGTNGELVNWPGSLRFKAYRLRVGRHNIAGKRYDVWFSGPNNTAWHGTQYGDNTQICHCKQIKN